MQSLVLNEGGVTRLFDGGKTAIVCPEVFKNVDLQEPYLICQKLSSSIAEAHGILKLTEVEIIDLEQFVDRENQHRISDVQKSEMWGEVDQFRFHRFEIEEIFDSPMLVELSYDNNFVNNAEFIVAKKVTKDCAINAKKDSTQSHKSANMNIVNTTQGDDPNANIEKKNQVSNQNDSETSLNGNLVKTEFHTEKSQVLKVDQEQRIVLGVVLEPDVEDAQGDILTAETIRVAAHGFLLKHQTIGVMHEDFSRTDELKIVESFIAPVDMEINDIKINKGTWMMATKILDDEIWASVKDGTFGGYSIGGFGNRPEVEFDE